MDEYHERRVSRATVWSRRLAVFAAVLLIVACLAHRFGYLATPDLLPVLGVVFAVVVLSLLVAGRALALFWRYGGKGGGTLVFAVLVAFAVLSPFAITAYRGVTLPTLNDISTDTDDPPELRLGAANRTEGMASIEPFTLERRKLQDDSYPEATGRRYEAPIGQVVEVVVDLIESRGWKIVGPSEFPAEATEVTVEARARSLILRLPADIAVRMIDEGASTYVDMRSASLYGSHDFGDNAARIVSFMADLDVEIAYLTIVRPVEPTEPPPPEKPPETALLPPPEEPAEPLDRSEDPPD